MKIVAATVSRHQSRQNVLRRLSRQPRRDISRDKQQSSSWYEKVSRQKCAISGYLFSFRISSFSRHISLRIPLLNRMEDAHKHENNQFTNYRTNMHEAFRNDVLIIKVSGGMLEVAAVGPHMVFT